MNREGWPAAKVMRVWKWMFCLQKQIPDEGERVYLSSPPKAQTIV